MLQLSLTGDLTVSKEDGFLLQTTGVTSVTGEAFVNNRKRKLIPSYEITLQGSWKGTAPLREQSYTAAYICRQTQAPCPWLMHCATLQGTAMGGTPVRGPSACRTLPMRTRTRTRSCGWPQPRRAPCSSAPSRSSWRTRRQAARPQLGLPRPACSEQHRSCASCQLSTICCRHACSLHATPWLAPHSY